ncbi:ABC transporter permease [Thermoguttaceae bacterium LCP21S3_D4]
MQVFKTFLKIAKKRFPSVLLYYIIFTVIVIALSKIGASDHETSFTATKADICIMDEDDSTASHALSDYLFSIHNPVTLKDTDTMTLQDALYYQEVDYILTIPEDFEEQLTASDAKDFLQISMRKDSSNGYFVDQQVNEYLSSVRLFMAGGFSLSEAVTKSAEALSEGNDTSILNIEEDNVKGTQIGLTYFFQYLPYVLINMLLLGMTPILITFNQKDLGARISCSSLSLKSKNTQITLGCIVFCLFVWLLFILTALFIYGADSLFSVNGLRSLLNSIMVLLFSVALSLLISTFSLKAQSLSMIANVVSLGLSFLSGIFVPQYLLGKGVLAIAHFLPTYWYVRINSMLGGMSDEILTTGKYWRFIGIQFGFFVAVFCIYLVSSKYQKRSHNA